MEISYCLTSSGNGKKNECFRVCWFVLVFVFGCLFVWGFLLFVFCCFYCVCFLCFLFVIVGCLRDTGIRKDLRARGCVH